MDTLFNNYRLHLEIQEKNKEIYKYVRIFSGVYNIPDYKTISPVSVNISGSALYLLAICVSLGTSVYISPLMNEG